MILASDQRLYTGITTDIRRRWQQHKNKQGAKFFYGRKPIALCYLEGDHDRRSASQREYAIRHLSRDQKWQMIIEHYGPAQRHDPS
ncbi:MAG: GIY-YIG nuclease family protein [Pseudomonadota bacterium]